MSNSDRRAPWTGPGGAKSGLTFELFSILKEIKILHSDSVNIRRVRGSFDTTASSGCQSTIEFYFAAVRKSRRSNT